jgi:hypothetical protein
MTGSPARPAEVAVSERERAAFLRMFPAGDTGHAVTWRIDPWEAQWAWRLPSELIADRPNKGGRGMNRNTAFAAAPLAALALVTGCGGGGAPRQAAPAKLPPAAICQRYQEQVDWLTYMSDPSPADIATLDRDVASDASVSADASLTAALRSEPRLGEVIASGADPVDYERPVSDICSNYPT